MARIFTRSGYKLKKKKYIHADTVARQTGHFRLVSSAACRQVRWKACLHGNWHQASSAVSKHTAQPSPSSSNAGLALPDKFRMTRVHFCFRTKLTWSGINNTTLKKTRFCTACVTRPHLETIFWNVTQRGACRARWPTMYPTVRAAITEKSRICSSLPGKRRFSKYGKTLDAAKPSAYSAWLPALYKSISRCPCSWLGMPKSSSHASRSTKYRTIFSKC